MTFCVVWVSNGYCPSLDTSRGLNVNPFISSSSCCFLMRSICYSFSSFYFRPFLYIFSPIFSSSNIIPLFFRASNWVKLRAGPPRWRFWVFSKPFKTLSGLMSLLRSPMLIGPQILPSYYENTVEPFCLGAGPNELIIIFTVLFLFSWSFRYYTCDFVAFLSFKFWIRFYSCCSLSCCYFLESKGYLYSLSWIDFEP